MEEPQPRPEEGAADEPPLDFLPAGVFFFSPAEVDLPPISKVWAAAGNAANNREQKRAQLQIFFTGPLFAQACGTSPLASGLPESLLPFTRNPLLLGAKAAAAQPARSGRGPRRP